MESGIKINNDIDRGVIIIQSGWYRQNRVDKYSRVVFMTDINKNTVEFHVPDTMDLRELDEYAPNLEYPDVNTWICDCPTCNSRHKEGLK